MEPSFVEFSNIHRNLQAIVTKKSVLPDRIDACLGGRS